MSAFANKQNPQAPWVDIVRKNQGTGLNRHVYNELNVQVGSRAYQMYVLSGDWLVVDSAE